MPAILACTDGSVYATSVYQHAAWAAHRLGTTVEVLHVTDRRSAPAAHVDLANALGFDASMRLTEELISVEEAYARVLWRNGGAFLDEAREQLAREGITGISTMHRHGPLVETLAEVEPHFDLVVIGKRGEHADFAKGHLGANLERMVRTATKPILVASRAFQPIHQFLIAYDGGPSVQRAVEFVLASPLLRGATCHILRAGHVDDNARWFLHETAARLSGGGFSVVSHVIPGDPAHIIAETMKAENIPLLVMGAYGHSAFRTMILGSTTSTMLRTCHVPVLMFR